MKVKSKKRNITDLATTTALTAAENKISDHSKNITVPKFNKLIEENFTTSLAKEVLPSKRNITNFVKETEFDDKNVTSNKKNM